MSFHHLRGRRPMIRISLPYIYTLANQLEPLASLPTNRSVKYEEVFFDLVVAHAALGSLINGSLFAPYLRSSWSLGSQLLAQLDGITKGDYERELNQFELIPIKTAYDQYKIALLAELGSLDSFFVTRKGAFDTFTLLQSGEQLMPTDLGQKVPEAVFDVREAAKCLAYEVPTAAGYHTFRAVESVLRRYYSQVTSGAAPPKVRSLGVYIAALTRAGMGEPKIIAALKQMNELHRNPLIHPEAVLTTDEAIAILGAARSAITAMLAVLQATPPTTQTPAVIAAQSGP